MVVPPAVVDLLRRMHEDVQRSTTSIESRRLHSILSSDLLAEKGDSGMHYAIVRILTGPYSVHTDGINGIHWVACL